jgi:hypothetical protein
MQYNYYKHTTLIALIVASFSLAAPAVLAQGAKLEGARYSYVEKHDDGSWESVFYRVNGDSVTLTESASQGGQHEPATFTITNGSFFIPMPAGICISAWNTDDCGRLHVIKGDAIYLSFLVNGRPLRQTGSLLISPKIPRQY